MSEPEIPKLAAQIRMGTLLWGAFGNRPGFKAYWTDVAYDVMRGRACRCPRPTVEEENSGDPDGMDWVVFEL